MTHTFHRSFLLLLMTALATFTGCTPHTNLLTGWRYVGMFSSTPAPEAIRADAAAYFRGLSASEKNVYFEESLTDYLEDRTGQHAAVLNAPHDAENWRYAVIYDRDNRRIKTLQFSVGGYSS